MSEASELRGEAEYRALLTFIGGQGKEATIEKIAEFMKLSKEDTEKVLADLQRVFLVAKEGDHFRLLSFYEALKAMADEASRGLQPLHPPWFEAREEYLITTHLARWLGSSKE